MLIAEYYKHILHFKFDAGTSRGVMKERVVWFIKLYYKDNPSIYGIGECAPLPGLSIDYIEDFEAQLKYILQKVSSITLDKDVLNHVNKLVPSHLPSICFGVEMAILDLIHGGSKIIFKNGFAEGEKDIPINGLVWMGDKESMMQQVNDKIDAGFSCIKIKIGAINFKEECEILEFIRTQYSDRELEIRVDANGAFNSDNIYNVLNVLKEFQIHSIEQPIKVGQNDIMAQLCETSPIPIALDEELIGKINFNDKLKLLKTIKPHYIILKPTLLGGFGQTLEWIEIAKTLNIEWWITSALESNIGLNAIAQFTANYQILLKQGLGTGMLYHNNIESPLKVKNGSLFYDLFKEWGSFSFTKP